MEGGSREEAGYGLGAEVMGAGVGSVAENPQKAGGRGGGVGWDPALDGRAVGGVSRFGQKEPRYRGAVRGSALVWNEE